MSVRGVQSPLVLAVEEAASRSRRKGRQQEQEAHPWRRSRAVRSSSTPTAAACRPRQLQSSGSSSSRRAAALPLQGSRSACWWCASFAPTSRRLFSAQKQLPLAVTLAFTPLPTDLWSLRPVLFCRQAEDDKLSRVMISKFLTKWGFGPLTVVEDGQLAIEAFRDGAQSARMPACSGVRELAAVCYSASEFLPVLLSRPICRGV